jgi:hypothetical protein
VEDRKDLLNLLLDGLDSDEREHVEKTILLTTNQKYARLRREPEPEPAS